ncbi:MAG TPA: hypothetical protein VLH60_02485 [Sedimentisphaerales bacterium]|nr:hypothetical protein [Sedimentisphaerales bacterium]
MATTAPFGKYRKQTFMIYIFVCLGLTAWFIYDGYFNQSFIEKHTVDGEPNSTLLFNRRGPIAFVPIAILVALRWWMVKDRKIVADGTTLILDTGKKIAYDSIEKIDKKDFEKKGHFTITYRSEAGQSVARKLSDRHWDKLDELLAELVSAVKGDASS